MRASSAFCCLCTHFVFAKVDAKDDKRRFINHLIDLLIV